MTKPYDATPRLYPISPSILNEFWILNLMTNPKKPYDTTPRLELSGYVVRG